MSSKVYPQSKLSNTSHAMSGYSGGPVRDAGGRAVQFKTSNPFEALSVAVQSSASSGSGGSAESPPSPQGSVSSTDTVTGKTSVGGVAIISSTSTPGPGHTREQAAHHGFFPMSPEMVSRKSTTTPNIPSSFSSPVRKHVQEPQSSGFGPSARRGSTLSQGGPLYTPPPLRRDSMDSQNSTLYTPPQLRRDSMVSQGPAGSYASPARRLTGSSIQPPMMHPSIGVRQTMNGISEAVAVEEFAFRRGQQDRGSVRTRIPKNPFHPVHNQAWELNYLRGKQSKTPAVVSRSNAASPSGKNYAWPILINPYTQNQEHPNGSFDAEWAQDMIIRALDSMAAIISMILKRGKQGEWQRAVCDVPAPVAEALSDYPHLMGRYEKLKRDAQEAIAGGRPQGYTQDD